MNSPGTADQESWPLVSLTFGHVLISLGLGFFIGKKSSPNSRSLWLSLPGELSVSSSSRALIDFFLCHPRISWQLLSSVGYKGE